MKNNVYSFNTMGKAFKVEPGMLTVITGSPPCQDVAPRRKVPLYNVYQHDKLVYGSADFIQCTRFMALQVGEANGVITLTQAFQHGFTMKAIA